MKNVLSAEPRGLAVAEAAVGELRPGAAQLSPAACDAASHKGGLSCSSLARGPRPQRLGRDAPWGRLLALGVFTAAQSVFTRGGRAHRSLGCSSALAAHTVETPISCCHNKGQ